VLGIVLAAAIGYGIYKGGVKLNMARFFRITGLILVPMLALVAWPSGRAKKPRPVTAAPATAVGQPAQQ
jgi:high-affinity Fe2+/Pb2+ permease